MLRGRLEWAGRFGAGGWARLDARPAELDIRADGRLLARVVADEYRPDLARAGEGDGAVSFTRWFAAPLPTGTQLAVTTADGTHLPGSPLRIAPVPMPPASAWQPDAGAPVALMVDEAVPDPARDAASAAVLSHAAALRDLGYAVTLVTLAEAPAALARLAGRVRLAWLHRMRPMLDLHGAVRAANPGVRILFALADLASLRLARAHAVLGGDAAALAGLRGAEAAALTAADVVVTHSPAEASLLEVGWPALRVAVVPWAVVPATPPPPFAARAGIGFLGNFGHAPNRDAALVLLDAVMPLVRQRGRVPCVIAGYGLPPALAARADALVTLLDSPQDAAASLWRRVRVSAAPLRFGAGIKGKVLDSLAHGVPCVCTPIAAEGLSLPSELIAGDAATMAARLWHLHEDAAANAAAAGAGLARMVPMLGEAAVRAAMARAVGRPGVIAAVSPRAAPSPALRPRTA